MSEELANAIIRVFESADTSEVGFGAENIVDVICRQANQTERVAQAITPQHSMAGQDASGGRVSSLTEAVMGMTAALMEIATAIGAVAVELGHSDTDQ